MILSFDGQGYRARRAMARQGASLWVMILACCLAGGSLAFTLYMVSMNVALHGRVKTLEAESYIIQDIADSLEVIVDDMDGVNDECKSLTRAAYVSGKVIYGFHETLAQTKEKIRSIRNGKSR